MKNSSAKPGKEKLQDKKDSKTEEEALEQKAVEERKSKIKVSREHDFSHTHPSHARHKNFGLDHEPGAF